MADGRSAPWRHARRGLIGTALSAVALATVGCGGDAPRQLHGVTRTPAQHVGALSLPDATPRRAGTTTVFRGRRDGLMLVYFGYTFCPDVCPTTLSDVRQALDRLRADERRRIQVSMITVDPRRDSGPVLDRYLSHFLPARMRHALRTTDTGELRSIERAFGAQSSIGPTGKDGYYEVSHTALLYAVDDTGTVRLEWPFGTPADDLHADLRTLLARSESPLNTLTGDGR